MAADETPLVVGTCTIIQHAGSGWAWAWAWAAQGADVRVFGVSLVLAVYIDGIGAFAFEGTGRRCVVVGRLFWQGLESESQKVRAESTNGMGFEYKAG